MKDKRFLSFTFDDGFINGAKKIDRILNPYKGTFYIVTGWVHPDNVPFDLSHEGADRGSFGEWKELSCKGHDVGSHTVTHALPDSPDAEREYKESFEFIKKMHNGPYNFSFPKDIESNKDLSFYDSVRIGKKEITYNDLDNVNLNQIISWSPIIQIYSEKSIFNKIKKAPLNSWTIIEMHSLDGEGPFPWPSKALKSLLDFVVKENFEIKTVGDMVKTLKNS